MQHNKVVSNSRIEEAMKDEEKFKATMKTLKEVGDALADSIHALFGEQGENFKTTLAKLESETDKIDNVIGTLVNWVHLQKEAYRSILTIYEWTTVFVETPDVVANLDELRMRIRLMLIPQIKNFTTVMVNAERTSQGVIQTFQNIIESLPTDIQNASDKNLQMLDVLEYDPVAQASILDTSISSLYRGDFAETNVLITKLKDNIANLKKIVDS